MRGTLYTTHIKKLAEKWRSSGKTYSEIRKRFGIPKSTLSVWFGKKYAGIFTREKQLTHLAATRPLAIAAIKKRIRNENQSIKEKISSEIKNYPLENIGLQKSVLAALYWAEGSKHSGMSGLKFANTDPALLRLFITLLRNCFHPDEKRFHVILHLHYYHSIKECKNLWSKQLDIPLTQFWKTYLKKRSVTKRYRKNFMGICFLYHSNSIIRKEMMELGYQLQRHIAP